MERSLNSRSGFPAADSLTDADFARIARIARAEFGLSLSDSKKSLVYSRVVKRLRTLGLERFDVYCALIERPDGAAERIELLSALTTNVTRFFREDHHFTHLQTTVLPGLIDRARNGGRVRVWSAGCSSGQEPFSLAMTVLRMRGDIGRHNFKILATDIDPVIIAKAQTAIYPDADLDQLPADLRTVPMVEACDTPDHFRIGQRVRDLVTFGVLNLIGDMPLSGPFDVIFCRNVAIYFDRDTQQLVWQRFANLLAPGGHLYIGHSERVSGPGAAHLTGAGITIYRKHDPARSLTGSGRAASEQGRSRWV